jgi:hypothetical protein
MMKIRLFTGIIFCATCINPSYSQDSTNSFNKTNAINIYPLSLPSGFIRGNFEHLFGMRHGLMIEGDYQMNKNAKGYDIKLDYRYHYFKNKNPTGLKSSFFGPFLYYEKSKNQIEVESESYSVDYKALKAGIEWGHRWIFWKNVNVCFNIGYGFPIVTTYGWSPNRPENGDKLELLATIQYGLLSELSIGVAF